MKLLVLDLDETLLHATEFPLQRPYDYLISGIYIYLRPGVFEFLDFCFSHFDVAIWSSGSQGYVQSVISIVFGRYKFVFVWDLRKCTHYAPLNTCIDDIYGQNGEFAPLTSSYCVIKKLSKLKKKYPLESILIVDDTPEKCIKNYGNAIYIKPFYGSINDKELYKLSKYLLTLKDIANVRIIEKRNWE